jgi:hypothetical protein
MTERLRMAFLPRKLAVSLAVKPVRRDPDAPDGGPPKQPLTCPNLAERVGFEPTVSFPTHDFQSCRFGRSRTPPALRQASLKGPRTRVAGQWVSLVADAAVGPCATGRRKPGQGLTAAALSGPRCVP